MRRTLASRSLAAAATTVLLLGLTACGGDEEPTGGDSGGEATVEQPEAGSEVEPADFVEDLQAGLEESTTAEMSMVMSGAGGSTSLEAEGQVDYTTDPVTMALTMSNEMMGDQPLELRLVDGVMFMNMGPMTNNKFVSYDLSDSESLPPGLDGLQQQMDPLSAVEQMEDALTSVTYAGEEDLDGEDLHRYDLTLDPAKLDSMEGMAGAGAPEEMAYELYVDDAFRIRQMTISVDAGGEAAEVEVQLFDWGTEVDIEAPDADDVVDPSQMTG